MLYVYHHEVITEITMKLSRNTALGAHAGIMKNRNITASFASMCFEKWLNNHHMELEKNNRLISFVFTTCVAMLETSLFS